MAALGGNEIVSACQAILSAANKIQELGGNWYKATASWEDFPRKVNRLSRKYDFWHTELTKFGMLSDAALVSTLLEAKLLLEAEEAKLLKRQLKADSSKSWSLGFWRKLSMTVFPAQVDLSIDTVIKAFDDIPQLLHMEENANVALGKRELHRTSSLPFRKDYRYVPLKGSESAIHSALKTVNGDGPAIVLLHGGAGKGKSTLARAIALHYNKAADEDAMFQHVAYLECGPQADIFAKQFKLFQLLGADHVAADPMQAQTGQVWQAGHDSDSNWAIPKQLKGLLRDQKLLIVFDDIWEEEFLQRMVDLCGRKVKCLVTSQRGDLCRRLNCQWIDILIEDVQPEDARKILASHVGLPNGVLPEHLKTIADKMIRETERNPLALASIATGIDHARSNELGTWEVASSQLVEMLRSEDTAHILSVSYPRSFWSATQLSLKFLKEDARTLLVLVHMCDGSPVPEEVMDLLYRRTKVRGGSAAFAKFRKDLESRELVNITPGNQRSWSVHSLQKRFIEEEMKDSKESIFTSLGGLSSTKIESAAESEIVTEEAITITLSALYFDNQFSTRAASMIGIPSHRFTKVRRSAIEPVTRLLAQPLSDQWTEALRTSTKRVFMGYICRGVMNDQDVSDLLVSRVSTLAMMYALKGISILGETILDENRHRFMKALTDLMEGGGDPSIRGAAGLALCHLCHNELHRAFIVRKLPRFVEAVVRVLLTDSHPEMVLLAAIMLGSLSLSQANATQIVNQHPAALVSLVKSLSKKDNPSLPASAALTLASLARGDNDSKFKIANSYGAIEELVQSLSKDDNPELQKQAARALAHLAHGDDTMKLRIVNSHGTMEKLAWLLLRDDRVQVQKQAVCALSLLAGGDDETKLKITSSPRIVFQLVKLLSKDGSLYIQHVAASTLSNLASGDDQMKLKIANSFGVLKGLVISLSRDDNPILQKQAAWALANLAGGNDEIKLKITNSPGAVDQLVKSLFENADPSVQLAAASALFNLAGGDNKMKLEITTSHLAIEGLAKSLSMDDNPDLQQVAALALARLAGGDGETQMKIVNSPSTIEQLVKSLSKDNNPTLQEHAARCIQSLAAGMLFNTEVEEVHINMLKLNASQGLMDGLLGLLAENISPSTQRSAACALALIYPAEGNKALLYSASAYSGRGYAKMISGLYKESRADLDKADNAQPGDRFNLSSRCSVRANLGDYRGALADANNIIEVIGTLGGLQENGVLKRLTGDLSRALTMRGVLKRKMGDLPGALVDLNKALDMGGYVQFLMNDEIGDYEVLKHRAYVKFLMNDKIGARADAEHALRIKPSRVDKPGYGRAGCLGTSSVFNLMGYTLK